MKVLLYAHAFAPRIGGAETSVRLLAEGLARGAGLPPGAAATVCLVTPTPRGSFDDRQLPFSVVRQPGLATLWRSIRQSDVVHLAGPCFLPLLFALAQRKPVVVEHHGYQAACLNGLLLQQPSGSACPGQFLARRYWRCLRCQAVGAGWPGSLAHLALTMARRWLAARATAHVFITSHIAPRIHLRDGRVIYYGVPEPPPPQAGPAQHANTSRALPTFACVGRFVSEKGLPVLVQAAALLDAGGCPIRLRLVGDGPDRPQVQRLVRQLGLQDAVELPGFLAGDALEAALTDVLAVVMPSIWEETAGLSAIEHMMRGRLVIASDIGGLGEIVDGAGMKFPPGDAPALAACLRAAAEQPALVAELGQKARGRAQTLFRHDRMVAEHWALYQEIV